MEGGREGGREREGKRKIVTVIWIFLRMFLECNIFL